MCVTSKGPFLNFRMVPKALKCISYLVLGRLSLSIFSLLAFSLAASILNVIANEGAIMHTHQHPRNIQTTVDTAKEQ